MENDRIKSSSAGRVLVVEDDEQVRSMLCRTLKFEGFHVEEASNGREALEIYERRPIDLIITDIFMPEKPGLGMIKELFAKFRDVKIIAISGGSVFAPQNYLDIAKKFGARRTFSKPVDRKQLVAAVHEVLQED